MNKRITLIFNYLSFKDSTLGGGVYTIVNPLSVFFRRKGLVKLSDGYSIPFDKQSKKIIMSIVDLALTNGFRFGEQEYQWKLDIKKGIIETPQGIKFSIKQVRILDETFLYQVHFSGMDLKDKVVVTAGAYIGDTPLFYSYYGAKVYGFEPDPNSYSQALENIELNPELSKNIVMKNYAIGKDEELNFPINPNGSGSSSVFNLKNRKTVSITSKSISTILQEYDITDPYLLDLDIKGSEFTVIEDSSIGKFQKIRMEYSPYILHSENKTLGYLIGKLKSYGFSKIRIYKHNNMRFDLINHGTIEGEK